MIDKIIDKIKGWWHNMFDYNKIVKDFGLDLQTSKEMLDAIQEWSRIFNKQEPWIDKNTTSLHVPKTICEKVAEAVVVEYKGSCSDKYIDGIFQKFLENIQTNTEYMIGKSLIYFRPYYDGNNIPISVIQADKFIPVSFNDEGNLTSCIIIDQITEESTIYTRLEYNKLEDKKIYIKNIVYKGRKDGSILENKISLTDVNKWKDVQETSCIDGVDKLIGGFASMKTANTIDNSCPIGMPIYHNAIETCKEIDKQFSRILWEYEGTELALDIDESMLEHDKKGKVIYPKGKERLFRKMIFDEEKDKRYNIFSPEIRDNPLFNGLDQFYRIVEIQCHLEHGTLCKADVVEKTAQEIKQRKQSYYITVSNIQKSLQNAFDDLIYGIYVLCKLYGIPVSPNYTIEHDWDDSILVDKESARNQSLIERNNDITSDVQYIMETRNMKEKDAIAFVKKQKEYRSITEMKEENLPKEE